LRLRPDALALRRPARDIRQPVDDRPRCQRRELESLGRIERFGGVQQGDAGLLLEIIHVVVVLGELLRRFGVLLFDEISPVQCDEGVHGHVGATLNLLIDQRGV
jgi:hypothetical protein